MSIIYSINIQIIRNCIISHRGECLLLDTEEKNCQGEHSLLGLFCLSHCLDCSDQTHPKVGVNDDSGYEEDK